MIFRDEARLKRKLARVGVRNNNYHPSEVLGKGASYFPQVYIFNKT